MTSRGKFKVCKMKKPPARARRTPNSVSRRQKFRSRNTPAPATKKRRILREENSLPFKSPGSDFECLSDNSTCITSFNLSLSDINNEWPVQTDEAVENAPMKPSSSNHDILCSTPILSGSDSAQKERTVSFLTTPSRDTRNMLSLSNWGLPEKVLEQYLQRGIKAMFEWQAECLMLPNVLKGGNLVYSAPTSAGKTLVAELLALKCVLETRKKVIIILPFVSTAYEKASYLQAIFEPQGVKVGGFMGSRSPPGGFAAVDIAICTIEKANSLVNHLLEERTTQDLGAVIVDELHMIGDIHRGYLLELLLTKLLYIRKAASAQHIQTVGMSATLPNIGILAKWLDAELFSTNYRPTPLHEMVKIGPVLYDTDFRKLREFDQSESIPGDEDDILLICREQVLKGHSVLIFCPTKAWCENLAGTLAEAQSGFTGGHRSPGTLDHHRLLGVCEQLRRTQVGLDHMLEKTVPFGVAFHHAGLTFEEREIIEGSFRQTLVKILIATSTLSSGVNLPARLVIVRTPFFQRSLVDTLVYKQMVGRAGRKGIDELGESILMCKPSERSKVLSLFKSAPKQVQSCLCVQNGTTKSKASNGEFSALKRALLEVIVSGVATSDQGIRTYMSCTLHHAELASSSLNEASGDDHVTVLNKPLDATLEFLLQNDFISSRAKADPGSSSELYPTQLGMATVSSALSPDEALVVFRELQKARRSFVLENELHIIYLVTPVYIQDQWPNIDWYKYFCMWERLPLDLKHVSDVLGIKESFLAQAVQGNIPGRTAAQRESHRVHRRFFTALALHDLVHEIPIRRVAWQYGATKGLLQTLQSAASTFAGMVTVFCNRLGWTNMELLLSQFQDRLAFGVERELCELVKVSLLNGFRARVLYNAGYHTLASLATANPMAVETCLRNAVPFKSYKLAAGGEGSSSTAEEQVRSVCNNTWCAKLRKGMSESEAAMLIVTEAKTILSNELHIPVSAWDDGRHLNGQPLQAPPSSLAAKIQPKKTPPPPPPQAGIIDDVARPSVATLPKSLSPPHGIMRSCVLRSEGDQEKECAGENHSLGPPGPCASNTISANDEVRMNSDFKSAGGGAAAPQDEGLPLRDCRLHLATPQGDLSLTTANTAYKLPDPNRSAEKPQDVQSSSYGDSFFECSFSPKTFPSTIPDSLPYSSSSDASLSFSFQTFAMIDAACNDVGASEDYEHKVSSTTGVGEVDANKPEASTSQAVLLQTPLKTPGSSRKYIPETPSFASSFHVSGLKELSSLCSSQLSQSGVTMINVTSNQVLFDTFIAECMEQEAVAFSIASASTDQSSGIGSVVVRTRHISGIPVPLQNKQVIGVSFCWGGTDVYYVSLCQDSSEDENTEHNTVSCSSRTISLACRIRALKGLFELGQRGPKLIAYDVKQHVKLLALTCGVLPADGGDVLDPTVADWMLNPDGKEKTLHGAVLQYLPDKPLLSVSEDCEEMPLSALATNVGDPEMRASAESILAFMLSSKLTVLLKAEELYDSYIKLEMPSLLVLAKIELNGIGFSPEGCTNQRDALQTRILELEQEAYNIAGHTFSLTSPEDIASVLFLELNLPCSSTKQQKTLGTTTRRGTRKRLQQFSTAKDVLEKIRPLHPLPGLVLEWRRISSMVTKMVYPLFKEAKPHEDLECFRIHPNVQIHTATGRVSVSDPNLQMVPKEFDIGGQKISAAATRMSLLSDSQYLRVHDSEASTASVPTTISMRNVFQPFPGAIFLTADYSQLELRILAHMSGDTKLRQFLNSDGDVFKMIAGEWLGIAPCDVTSRQRQNTKQVCYGMVYGIGSKALGEQLGIDDNEAAQFIDTFKSKYPTMRKYLSEVIQKCRDTGHVVTLLGRKRFLPGIHSTNTHVRSQAERQAVNTTIQGSAADLVKTAMINIDRAILELHGTPATCLLPSSNVAGVGGGGRGEHAAYLVLQLHDELLYEVWEQDLEHVVRIVQHGMENALELSVKFPVKLKTGHSWGNLKPFQFK